MATDLMNLQTTLAAEILRRQHLGEYNPDCAAILLLLRVAEALVALEVSRQK